MLSPQRRWHRRVVFALELALTQQAPDGFDVTSEMTVRLDGKNRPEPDVLLTTTAYEHDLTYYLPADVALAIEVISPESAHQDRTVKLRKYAEAGIRHYWCVDRVDDEDAAPVGHVYELDGPTGAYAPAGVFRHKLHRPVPFEITLDLDSIIRGRFG